VVAADHARKLGIQRDQVVQEWGWDEDTDDDIRADVEDAYAELGVPALAVHVREEHGSTSVMASFHERLWRRNETAVAFTCMPSVAQKLSTTGVPVFTLRPTGTDIRSALRTAARQARLVNGSLSGCSARLRHRCAAANAARGPS